MFHIRLLCESRRAAALAMLGPDSGRGGFFPLRLPEPQKRLRPAGLRSLTQASHHQPALLVMIMATEMMSSAAIAPATAFNSQGILTESLLRLCAMLSPPCSQLLGAV
jgi:hypothetical protein